MTGSGTVPSGSRTGDVPVRCCTKQVLFCLLTSGWMDLGLALTRPKSAAHGDLDALWRSQILQRRNGGAWLRGRCRLSSCSHADSQLGWIGEGVGPEGKRRSHVGVARNLRSLILVKDGVRNVQGWEVSRTRTARQIASEPSSYATTR